MPREKIGSVEHYFTDISVGIIDLDGKLTVGDRIHFIGSTTDFEQTVKSMQIDHEDVEEANRGDVIGMKVKDRVREGDDVLKIVD